MSKTVYSPELKEAVRIDLVDNQMDYAVAAEKHGVPYSNLIMWARRGKWPTKARTKKVLAKVGAEVNEQTAQTIAKTLLAQGQAHAEKVFAKASLACDRSNVAAPKNWKDFEIADRVARRAAGLNDDQTVVNTTLVHINETSDEEIVPVLPQTPDHMPTLVLEDSESSSPQTP